jgi:16S rRNA (cytosine1402-N4)-methyltransferase
MASRPGHTPVLREQVVELLSPRGRKLIVDCTIGLGGHAEALIEQADEDAVLIGLDVDESNLRRAKDRLASFPGRVRLFRANFSELATVLAEVGSATADVILADLGLASSQLDDAQRGFSFAVEGPLDMRMDDRLQQTAGDLVNTLAETDLADLIYSYGEERYSRRIARAIVAARKVEAVRTTTQLAEIAAKAYPAAARRTRRGVHPATRTFQALRIAVNDELANLDALLGSLPALLSVGGRAAMISFHSLEDRRVKTAFAALVEQGSAKLLTRKPITPSDEQKKLNPRSRSAKLRGIERV